MFYPFVAVRRFNERFRHGWSRVHRLGYRKSAAQSQTFRHHIRFTRNRPLGGHTGGGTLYPERLERRSDPAAHRLVLTDVLAFAQEIGFALRGLVCVRFWGGRGM